MRLQKGIRQNKIRKLWKSADAQGCMWSYHKHELFPCEIRNIIISILCLHNRNDSFFSLIPKDILIDMFENNIRWSLIYKYMEDTTELKKRRSYTKPLSIGRLNNFIN